MKSFFLSLLGVTARMSPYLLLGFLIAGVLHVYVPRKFYTRFLSRDNKWSVLWAALLGIPLPLCSCGVIPTAVGLKNEKASNGAVASFLIATPQTGIDSILATFSMMGLGFALMRPAAALITGVCGGFLVNSLVPDSDSDEACCQTAAAHGAGTQKRAASGISLGERRNLLRRTRVAPWLLSSGHSHTPPRRCSALSWKSRS